MPWTKFSLLCLYPENFAAVSREHVSKGDLRKFSCHSRPSRAEMPQSRLLRECSDLFPPRMQSRCAQTEPTEDRRLSLRVENSDHAKLHTLQNSALVWDRRKTHPQANPVSG